jgi:putative transposase
MPRRQIQFLPGQYYHIYNRGAGRQSIFREGKNYIFLLGLLKKVAVDCDISVIAYCLLPNHYHWLIRQNGEFEAGKLVARVFGSYSQAFNKVYNRSGTLFEGKFQAILVESDEYLRHLCRYIHANPVRHGISLSPDLWPYSNYLEWIGKRTGTLVDQAFVTTHFPKPGQYEAYVLSYLTGQANLPPGLRNYLEGLA